MSEQGWRAFLDAAGLEDWVILHGGPTAVFRTGTFSAGPRLASAIAGLPGLDGTRAQLTIVSSGVTVRLTREVWSVEPEQVALARAISHVARSLRAVADRGEVQEVQLAIAAKPDAVDLGFWRAVLGYAPMHEDNAIDPLGHGLHGLDAGARPARPLRHADARRCVGGAGARRGAAGRSRRGRRRCR